MHKQTQLIRTQTTKTKSVVVNCRTGFETISTMELIPNPNDGNATIVVGDEESNYEVIVNDMLGRTILKDNSTAAEYNLHLENQPKGMYLVKIKTQNILLFCVICPTSLPLNCFLYFVLFGNNINLNLIFF